jgi:hypothetical protein
MTEAALALALFSVLPILLGSIAVLAPTVFRLGRKQGAVLILAGCILFIAALALAPTSSPAERAAITAQDPPADPTTQPAEAPVSSRSSVDDMTAIEQAEIAFDGNPSQREIKRQLDRAMTLYELEITEENYSRAASVLVVMRKNNGVSEMEILDHMIRSHVPGVNIAFPEAAAISAVFLKHGDH